MKRLVVFFVSVLLMSLTLAMPAQAQHGYSVTGAKNHMLGGSTHNTKTHILDSIDGYYHFKATVHGKTKTFYGIHVSAQHCKKSGCWGPIHHFRIISPFRLGAKGVIASRASGSACGIYSALCWATDQVNKIEQAVVHHVINPCATGSAKGFGGILMTNLTVQTMFRGGLLTQAQFGKYFTGPVGIGVVSVATCTIGLGNEGINGVKGLFN